MAVPVKDKLVTVEGLGVTLGKDASGNDVENTYAKKDFSDYSVAPTPFNGNELIPLYYNGNNYSIDMNTLLSSAGGGGGTSQGALVNYVKNCGTISSSGDWPRTFEDANITSDMVVLEAVLGNPAAQTGDWDITTSNGSVTIGPKSGTSGGINGDTTLMLYFGVGMSTAPSLLTNLASTSSDNILKTAPRPGVMGVLGLANGGTGQNASSIADLRSKLGITPANIGAYTQAETDAAIAQSLARSSGSATPGTNVTLSTNQIQKSGNVCSLNLWANLSGTVAGNDYVLCTLPEGFRPSTEISVLAQGMYSLTSNYEQSFFVKIRTNGQVVTALGSGTFSGHIVVAGTYVI